jgi:hypothetical protein
VAEGQGEFSSPRVNLVVSRDGFSVYFGGRSTIRYEEAGKLMEVFAETLVTAEPKIAVRRSDVRNWHASGRDVEVTEAECARIIENVRRALAFKGWILVVE